MIDPAKLLAFIGSRETKDPVRQAIYDGLTTRIQAGQFDYEKDKEVPHDLVQSRRQPRVPPEGPRGG